MVKIKRIYDKPSESDGFRVYIDRLWPRGLTKEKAKIDLWFKDIAPTTELRKWFSHDPYKWQEFQKLYCDELLANKSRKDFVSTLAQHENVTILYSAHDTEHNNAVVIQKLLDSNKL